MIHRKFMGVHYDLISSTANLFKYTHTHTKTKVNSAQQMGNCHKAC